MPTLANIIKNIEPPIELTQEQYDALSEAQKNDGTVYFITDGLGPGITAGNISATDSEGDPSNVQAQLNKKIDIDKITTSTNVSTAGEYVADAQSIKSLNDALATTNANVANTANGLHTGVRVTSDLKALVLGQSAGDIQWYRSTSTADAAYCDLPSGYTYGTFIGYKGSTNLASIVYYPISSDATKVPLKRTYAGGVWSGWYDFAGTALS